MQLEIPLEPVQACAQAGQDAGLVVVLNAAPAQHLPPALLALTDVLVVNEGELAAVAGHHGSIAECLQRIAVPTVVVTLGHRALLHAQPPRRAVLPNRFSIAPVDTAGAGDAFAAHWSQHWPRAVTPPARWRAPALRPPWPACSWARSPAVPSEAAVDAFLADQKAASPADVEALQRYCTTTS